MLANISYFGKGLLTAIFFLCGFTAVLGLAALKLESSRAKRVLYRAGQLFLTSVGLSVVALVLLIVAFLTDDFSIAVVAQYSSMDLGFFYKLSAVWAGSAGSLLLWSVGVFLLFGLWLIKIRPADTRFEATALSIGSGICYVFSALCVFVVKPFAIAPAVIKDGMGLNPLLQNFWNVIHPPMLFVGYSAFLIPFVLVLAAVFTKTAKGYTFYRQLRRWLLFGICFLALGIATGAKWSYVELGWGGYWAWDPVENASLLPWLVAVAALHSLAGMRVADRFRRWAIILSPVPFILCLVATFITRSGVLASVHSFGQNAMFSALLTFIACCFLLWLIGLIRVVRTISIVSYPQKGVFRLDKSRVLFWTNIIFVFTAVVIGTATFWPIVSKIVTSSNSSSILTRIFYDRLISVVGIVLAFLVGLAALADLQKRSGFILQLLTCCLAGLLCCKLVFKLSEITLLITLACGICVFSFVAVSIKLSYNLKSIGKIGGGIAHWGLLLFVVAAGFSSKEQVIQTLLAKGGDVTVGQYKLVYDSFKHSYADGITQVGPEIVVSTNGLTKKLWPHNNLYPNGRHTSEVAIHTGLLEDIYLSFDGVIRAGQVVITAKLKPLMLWLWFGLVLIIAGSALAMFETERAGKPA